VIPKELAGLEKETKMLGKRAKLVDLYHDWMEEFNNLKMQYAFMKIELLIYQQRNKRCQVE
jgi:hypothetical protein